MYSVLVVDDEELICLGIKSMIERLGCPEIGRVLTAAGARDAEAAIFSDNPDIVITDIQMPGVNGLEMIKAMSSISSHVKFIVLSGYDDFQYVREALKLGVMDYLLKPASIGELKNVLGSAVMALNMEKWNSREESELKFSQLLLENNLRKLFLYRTLEEFEARVILDRITQFFPYKDFTVGIALCKKLPAPEPPGRAEEAGHSAGEGQSLSGPGWIAAGFLSDSGAEVVVFNHGSSVQASELAPILADMAASARNCPGFKSTLAFSGTSHGIESLMKLHRQAEKALSYRLILGDTGVIEYERIGDRVPDMALADRKLAELQELLKIRREEQLSGFIDGCFCDDNLASQSIDSVSRLFTGINRRLGSLAAGSQHPAEESARPLDSFATLQEVRIYFKERIHQILTALREEDTGNKAMAGLMNYIRENMGKKISLADTAGRAGISYTHFSKLFKKRSGLNFSEYLMKVRMEEAQRLLDDPALKVYEVAAKVGYNDPKHFSRAFSLFFKVSPMEYRAGKASQAQPERLSADSK